MEELDFYSEESIVVLHWLGNTVYRYNSLLGWKEETIQSLF